MDKVASNHLATNCDYSEQLTLSLRLSNDKKRVSAKIRNAFSIITESSASINIRVFHEISYGGANVNYKEK